VFLLSLLTGEVDMKWPAFFTVKLSDHVDMTLAKTSPSTEHAGSMILMALPSASTPLLPPTDLEAKKQALKSKIDKLDSAAFWIQASAACVIAIFQGIKQKPEYIDNTTFAMVADLSSICIPPIVAFISGGLLNERNKAIEENKALQTSMSMN